ncbi:MAG TPA: hypothetical protein VGE01_13645, partial [Fimbriimonas sp.]
DLHALADGELSAEQTSELRRKLETDAEGKEEFERIVALKNCLSSRSLKEDCRAEWRGCVERLHEIDRSRRVERVVGRYAWAMCGVFFLFILAGGIAQRGIAGNRVASEDIVHAATNLIPTRTPPMRNTMARDAYLDAMLGEANMSLDPDRLDILGGAVGEINGRRATRLTLRDANGDMALMVVSGALDFDSMPTLVVRGMALRVGSAEGMNMVAWEFDHGSAILIGSREHRELAETAQRIALR